MCSRGICPHSTHAHMAWAGYTGDLTPRECDIEGKQTDKQTTTR